MVRLAVVLLARACATTRPVPLPCWRALARRWRHGLPAKRRRSVGRADGCAAFAIRAPMRARRVGACSLCPLLAFLPGFFQHPAHRPRRGAVCASHEADAGDRRLRRHPLPGRGALQEAGRHLLAAGGRREDGKRARFPTRLTTIWLYRIPSLVGAVGAVLLTYWAALAFVSRRAALLAGLMMASCVLLGIERLMAKTDAMLLMTVVAAMGALARAYISAASGRAAQGSQPWLGACRPCSGPRWPPGCFSRGR